MSHQSLISANELASRIDAENLAIIDASFHFPASGRVAEEEFAEAHIPGALFLDLASLTDSTSPVPSALPRPDQLAQRLSELGIGPDHEIVLYDDSPMRTSARAWYLLNAHGIDAVTILDGGLGKWRDLSLPLASGVEHPTPATPLKLEKPARLRFKSDILANLENQTEQVLDARAADRVFGTGVDPVHGGQNGRIPGSCNLPYDRLLNSDGTFKPATELKTLFQDAGIDLEQPIITSCGSGITASVLLFALHLIGHDDWALYDGSWLEWSGDPNTPKTQGPA